MRTPFSALVILALAACASEPVAQQEGEQIACHDERLEDRTADLKPLLGGDALEIVAELPYPAGNVAVAKDGRLFFSFHPQGNKGDIKVAELVDGEAVAYPDEDFQDDLEAVLSVRIDEQNRLWMLDYGGNLAAKPARLYAIDLASDEVVFQYKFPREAAGVGSNLNDFQVSPDGKAIFISDQSLIAQKQALVVVDLDREIPIARRRLREHASVKDGGFDLHVGDRRITLAGLLCPRYGVDGVALDATGEFLYYSALNSGELFRIRTTDLRYEKSGLLDDALAQRVEKVADITATDGMTSDAAGHVYLTDMEHSAIVRVAPDGRLDVLVQDERLRWPDGFSWGPDGYLYMTASDLHDILPDAIVTSSEIAERAPYHIFRIQPQTACSAEQQCHGRIGH